MMKVHFFFVDMNDSGFMYRIGVECEEKIVAERYLQEYSNDVRYHKSKEKGNRDKGNKKIPIGTIRYCKYIGDKISTFLTKSRFVNAKADSRQVVYP